MARQEAVRIKYFVDTTQLRRATRDLEKIQKIVTRLKKQGFNVKWNLSLVRDHKLKK